MARNIVPRHEEAPKGKLETRLALIHWAPLARAVLAVYEQNCSEIYEAFGRKGNAREWFLSDELRRDVWERARKLWAPTGKDYLKFPFTVDCVADLYYYFATTKYLDEHRRAIDAAVLTITE